MTITVQNRTRDGNAGIMASRKYANTSYVTSIRAVLKLGEFVSALLLRFEL